MLSPVENIIVFISDLQLVMLFLSIFFFTVNSNLISMKIKNNKRPLKHLTIIEDLCLNCVFVMILVVFKRKVVSLSTQKKQQPRLFMHYIYIRLVLCSNNIGLCKQCFIRENVSKCQYMYLCFKRIRRESDQLEKSFTDLLNQLRQKQGTSLVYKKKIFELCILLIRLRLKLIFWLIIRNAIIKHCK